MNFNCAECSKELQEEVPILVDGKDLLPLDFCCWECLMKYAVKQHNRMQPTTGIA